MIKIRFHKIHKITHCNMKINISLKPLKMNKAFGIIPLYCKNQQKPTRNKTKR